MPNRLRASQPILENCSLTHRHTRKLLNYYGLHAEMLSYHDHNEKLRVTGIINRLQEGQVRAS